MRNRHRVGGDLPNRSRCYCEGSAISDPVHLTKPKSRQASKSDRMIEGAQNPRKGNDSNTNDVAVQSRDGRWR